MKKILIALLILIVAVATVYYAFPEQVAQFFISSERSKANLTRQEIKIDDHNIVYLEGGTGPTILLLHGYSADKDNWTRFAAHLTKNYHVVIPDLPGHGESSKLFNEKYNMISQITRLHKFTQVIKINKFHIAGNSMGGFFAGSYTVRYPDEVLNT